MDNEEQGFPDEHSKENPEVCAERLFEEAFAHQMAGDLEAAVRLYMASLRAHPTAQAHTFLGWTYSYQGKTDEAIRECHRAIALDPDYGNPYNDIGVYLIDQGKWEEAIPWLLKAIAAPNYEPRHYPHYNLSRVYRRMGRHGEAVTELRAALAEHPDYPLARADLARLLGELN